MHPTFPRRSFSLARRIVPALLGALPCLTLLSCSDDDSDPERPSNSDRPRPNGDPTADAGARPSDGADAGLMGNEGLAGVWRERGYARLVHIEGETVTEYHITEVSCTPAGEVTRAELRRAHDRIEVSRERLSWYERDHFTRHDFDRLASLPERCVDPERPDAAHVYDAFWHLFDENYAFFELRGVDWEATYAEYARQLDDESSDEELLAALSASIEPLDDGHVFVFDGVSQGFLSGSLGGLWERWATQYEGEPISNPINPRGDFIADMQTHVQEKILRGEGRSAIHGLINWGWLEDDIGYLELHEFYYPFDEEPSIREIRAMVDDAMVDVTTDLHDARAVVIDIRFNQGGSDSMGYAIVSWLTEAAVLVARKRAAHDGGWTKLQDVVVEPRGTEFFDKPIALLQSANSISAAETFALAMNELPQVTSVGTPSYGVLSDVLQRVLSNGWIVALSNEVYEAPAGDVYEAVGVPVDVEVPYDEALNYYENLDRTLERAVAELRAGLDE